MTITGSLLPPLHVQYTPEPKRQTRRYIRGPLSTRNSTRKFDTEAMLRERMDGELWEDIEKRHGVKSQPGRTPGSAARQLCMNSAACKRLRPEEVVKLERAPRKKPGPRRKPPNRT